MHNFQPPARLARSFVRPSALSFFPRLQADADAGRRLRGGLFSYSHLMCSPNQFPRANRLCPSSPQTLISSSVVVVWAHFRKLALLSCSHSLFPSGRHGVEKRQRPAVGLIQSCTVCGRYGGRSPEKTGKRRARDYFGDL